MITPGLLTPRRPLTKALIWSFRSFFFRTHPPNQPNPARNILLFVCWRRLPIPNLDSEVLKDPSTMSDCLKKGGFHMFPWIGFNLGEHYCPVVRTCQRARVSCQDVIMGTRVCTLSCPYPDDMVEVSLWRGPQEQPSDAGHDPVRRNPHVDFWTSGIHLWTFLKFFYETYLHINIWGRWSEWGLGALQNQKGKTKPMRKGTRKEFLSAVTYELNWGKKTW